jgi:hypothetical protein
MHTRSPVLTRSCSLASSSTQLLNLQEPNTAFEEARLRAGGPSSIIGYVCQHIDGDSRAIFIVCEGRTIVTRALSRSTSPGRRCHGLCDAGVRRSTSCDPRQGRVRGGKLDDSHTDPFNASRGAQFIIGTIVLRPWIHARVHPIGRHAAGQSRQAEP